MKGWRRFDEAASTHENIRYAPAPQVGAFNVDLGFRPSDVLAPFLVAIRAIAEEFKRRCRFDASASDFSHSRCEQSISDS